MTVEARGDDGGLAAREGELRRLTIMFCDVVGSTELSGRQEPETYRELMRGYRAACRDVIESRFEGHIVQLKGDGTLSTFGFPVAHENDAERAVRAGLALVGAVRELSLEVRVAVHHGPVYLDFDDDDIYGLAANVGARLHAVAEPGTVVVSDDIRLLVEHRFEIEGREPQVVKGVAEPLTPFVVVDERPVTARRSWSGPLVERDEELAQLRGGWAQAIAGTAERPAGVLLRGEAGVGKSRLVAALVEEVRGADAAVVELHGSPFHVDAGFHPVRTLVEGRCGIDGQTAAAQRLGCLVGDLASLGLDASATVPLLAPILRIDPSAGYDAAPTEGRKLEEQVASAALGYLVACAAGRPAVVVAENLHWFDEATRSLLGDLLWSGPGTVLVVGTSRGPQAGRWETIELRPLTLEGGLALVAALDEGLDEEDRLALAQRSSGIPLYLEELVRARADDPGGRPTPAVPVPGSVPEALYEPLVARLYATPAALPVAATAAATGQEVDRALLAATMPIDDDELDATLRTLVDARVLEPVGDRASRYRFRHELLREVAYELQPPSWRRRVHDRLCDLLAGEEPTDWHVLASHFERAGRHSEAAAAFQQTAEWARRRGALDEARAHLTHAIELAAPLDDDPGRDHLEIGLRLRRGFLAMSVEGAASADASADLDRCRELAEADPRSDDRFSTLISLWPYYLGRAELDRAREVTEALRDAIDEDREVLRPHNRGGFGILDWFGGDFASAAATFAVVADEFVPIGDVEAIAAVWFVPNDPTVAMVVHVALSRFMAGDLGGADKALARGRALAASLDFPQGPWSAAYTSWMGSWIAVETGRFDAADEAVAALWSSSSRHGFDSWELIASTQSALIEGMRALRSGAEDATALSAHADAVAAHIEAWQIVDLRIFLPFYLTTIGALLAASGDAEGARRRYEESLELAAETGMRFYDAETARRLAHLAPDRAGEIAALRSAHDLARTQAARPFELRIALDLHGLTGDDARPLLEQAMRAFAEGTSTIELEEARARMLTRR